ncbi:C-C chemokine receptor type 1-like [Odontesthes bonariensis]|uniref:C-C chemokine receptor type 1-like n=1 Tax=Odontesthes bonariensis TaxID=219752 RepID=UPI003F58C66B
MLTDDYDNETFTPTFDYSFYYGNENTAPCENVDGMAFSRMYLVTLYSLVFMLGFMGNGLVVWVLVKCRNKTNFTDMCLFNLAISDLLFVFTLPFYTHYSMAGKWIFGDFLCRFVSWFHQSGFFSSIFFMVVMALDRYVIIMHSHKVSFYWTGRAGIPVTLFVWMLSMCVSLPSLVFSKVRNDSDEQGCYYCPENEEWKHYELFATNVLGLLIPLLGMVVCYSRVIPTLLKMRSTKRYRAVKLIFFVVVIFFLFWAPYNISLFLQFLHSKGIIAAETCNWDKDLRLSVVVTEAFAYTHCCLNPIIYAFVSQKFMKRTMQLLKRCVPVSTMYWSDSSFRRSSVSRSSEVTVIT